MEGSRWGRPARLVALVQRLLDHPGRLFGLQELGEETGAAKSTLSEDMDVVQEVLEAEGRGRLERLPGAAGGVRYRPHLSPSRMAETLATLTRLVKDPARIVPGGFVYLTDLVFSPEWGAVIGSLFATEFAGRGVEAVVTVETRGIPIGLMTARALGVPLVTVRRTVRLPEGPTLGVDYVSDTTKRVETMTLPRRALAEGTAVLVIDDFTKGGGTLRGVVSLMAECRAHVLGMGVFMETEVPVAKAVEGVFSLLRLGRVDQESGTIEVYPSPSVLRLERTDPRGV